jgi:hypothetical protein
MPTTETAPARIPENTTETMLTKAEAARLLQVSVRQIERLHLPAQLVSQPTPNGGTRINLYRLADVEAARNRHVPAPATVRANGHAPAPEPALWLPLADFSRLVGLSEALLVRWAIPEQVRACYDAGVMKCRRADAARVDPWAWEGFDPTTGEAL